VNPVLERHSSAAGLLDVVASLESQLAEAQTKASSESASRSDVENRLAEANSALEQATQEFEKRVTDLAQQLAAKQADVGQVSSSFKESLDAIEKQYSEQVEQRNQRINVLIQERQDLQRQIADMGKEVNKLQTIIRQTKPPGPGDTPLYVADGKIIASQPDIGIVYINIGAKDRVTAGLTFTIYDARTGITPDGEGKAVATVINVFQNSSECRVQQVQRNNPPVEGDLVANAVFDGTKTYSFVVDGEFDLDGDGRPDQLGSQRVKDMIRQYGGVVADSVTIETDFLVMGMEPQVPAKPEENAPPTTWQIYRDKLAEVEKFQNVQNQAASLQIPVLNTNRFLALVGFQAASLPE
jgi:hypothetical protein